MVLVLFNLLPLIPLIRINIAVNFRKSLLVISFLWAVSVLFYQGTWLKKLFLTSVIYILIYAVDDLVISGYMYLMNQTMEELVQNRIAYICMAFLAKVIYLIICTIFSQQYMLRRKKVKLSMLEWFRIFIIPVSMVLNLTIVIHDAIENERISIIICIDIVLLIVGTFVYLYLEEELEQRKNDAFENEILKQQRSLTHDFHNHLQTIRELLSDCQHNKEVIDYVDKIMNKTEQVMRVIQTNNPIIDALLNRKYAQCKSQNINMSFELNDLSVIPLKTEELTVILSNLLDNAIEACMKSDSAKQIKIKILHTQEEFILSVRNTTDHALNISDGEIVSSKRNTVLHGYGVKNTKNAVEKSGGVCFIECKNGWFQFTSIWN